MTTRGDSDGWDAAEFERAAALTRELRASVGADTRLVVVRAPGRVNLIGEHTDYSGLPVLPIAIDRSTVIAAAPFAPREIRLGNSDPAFGPRSFPIEAKIPAYPAGDWGNYIKAAVQGVIDHFGARGIAAVKLRGAMMIVEGRVPPAAGLSSSSALTVAAALAFMAVNGLELAPLECATMVARSERYVGTMGGGMDQAAALFGRRDHALFIEFNPLRVREVAMPSGAALVVADSREVADKSGRARGEYNRRVVECSIAARILSRALQIEGAQTLGDVVSAHANWTAAELIAVLARSAPPRLAPDLVAAARIIGVERDALAAQLLGAAAIRATLDPSKPLEILSRARHVLTETERVIRAAMLLEAGELEAMGALINASHKSLAEDFDCSTARLDRMVAAARNGGALGARLTGAGFGGSIVALCRATDAERVIDSLDREFYAPLGIDPRGARESLRAGAGASTIELAAA
ncbi:MAG TPA: galactokinase [Candidatus Binataceae bacterium]|nr:galactokinase [Candidatus Binataceae bacterium]